MKEFQISNDGYNIFAGEVKEKKHENIYNQNSGFGYDKNTNLIFFKIPGKCKIFLHTLRNESCKITLTPVDCNNFHFNKYFDFIINYINKKTNNYGNKNLP
jgi:hypothetical protein